MMPKTPLCQFSPYTKINLFFFCNSACLIDSLNILFSIIFLFSFSKFNFVLILSISLMSSEVNNLAGSLESSTLLAALSCGPIK